MSVHRQEGRETGGGSRAAARRGSGPQGAPADGAPGKSQGRPRRAAAGRARSAGKSPARLGPGGAVLAFDVAGHRYGLPAASVVRIIEMVAITPLPGAPEVVAGVVSFHGQVIPLLDMRRRLGQPVPPYTLRTPIIVSRVGERLAGLVVDTVQGIVELSPEQVESPDQILAGELALHPLYLIAVARLDEGLLLVLDPDALLQRQEGQSLARALSRRQES